MGILKGRVTASRFVVPGELPPSWREQYRSGIEKFSFREPGFPTKEQVRGWTRIDDMMESDFEDFNGWLLGDYLSLGLRVDKRTIPASKLRSEVKKKAKAWCEENGVKTCPKSIRDEFKELVEDDLISRVLPKTKHIEFVWNLSTNIAYASTHSESDIDMIRQVFFRSFGRKLQPMSPLEWPLEKLGRDVFNELLNSQPLNL